MGRNFFLERLVGGNALPKEGWQTTFVIFTVQIDGVADNTSARQVVIDQLAMQFLTSFHKEFLDALVRQLR